jgi:peptide/nickel transport system substrate-binding protein
MKKWKTILFTSVMIAVLSVSTTLSTLAQKLEFEGTLTTTINSDIMTMNPFVWGMLNEKLVLDHIYEPLVRYDVNNVPQPALCTEWQHSTDLMTWTFTLKSNAYWHDDQIVDTGDVEFTWDLLTNDPLVPRRSWIFDSVDYITIINQTTIEIVFYFGQNPADILYDFASTLIVPEHIWDGIDIYDFDNLNPIGCGPFEFVSRDPGVRITLARHADYHLNGPWVNEKIIEIEPDKGLAFDLLNASSIDVLDMPDLEDELYAQTDPDIAIHDYLQDYWMYLALNQRRWPNNITEFRRAIYYGINKPDIVNDAIDGRGVVCPASGSLPYGPYYNPSVTTYDYDVLTANATLDSIGVVDSDADGWREANGTEISFELLVSSEAIASVEAVNLIRGHMHDIGINVSVTPVLFSVLWQTVGGTGDPGNTWDYDWAFLGWVGFWSDFHPSWAYWLFSKNNWWGSDDVNIPGWNNTVRDQVSDLSDEVSVETSDVIIKQKLDLIQELVADDLPYLPIYILGGVTLYRIDEFEDWIMGYVRGPDSWDSWLTVHLIGVPTVFEYIHLAGIFAAIVIGFFFASKIRNHNRKRR